MITKNKKNFKKRDEKIISLFEIFILIVSIAAFAYFVGAEFGVVSAKGPGGCKKDTGGTFTDAIAINDNNSVDVLANREEVFQIAEEYAHAGIRLLHDKIKSTQLGGSFDKQFEKELIDIYKELDLGENGEKDTSG